MLALLDDLLIQLGDITTERCEEAASCGRDAEGLARSRVRRIAAALEPAILLHPSKRGVQRPWAQRMAVLGKLVEEPQAPDLP